MQAAFSPAQLKILLLMMCLGIQFQWLVLSPFSLQKSGSKGRRYIQRLFLSLKYRIKWKTYILQTLFNDTRPGREISHTGSYVGNCFLQFTFSTSGDTGLFPFTNTHQTSQENHLKLAVKQVDISFPFLQITFPLMQMWLVSY